MIHKKTDSIVLLHLIQNNHNRGVCVPDCGPKCRLMGPLLAVQFPAYDDMHTISLNEKLSGPPQFWTGERQIKQMSYQKILTGPKIEDYQTLDVDTFEWKSYFVSVSI